MEWAKGLKDRVERTAGELKSQAATAFTPPDEEGEGEGGDINPSTAAAENSSSSHPPASSAAGGAAPSSSGTYGL